MSTKPEAQQSLRGSGLLVQIFGGRALQYLKRNRLLLSHASWLVKSRIWALSLSCAENY